MTTPHGVAFDVERPPSFAREHLILRIGVLIVVGWMVHPLGVLWLGLPVIAAILIAQRGGRAYVDDDGPKIVEAIGWIIGLTAYVALLTDELPRTREPAVRFHVDPAGSPTVASALLRIVYAIPSILALSILTIVASVAWVIAALYIFANGRYPTGLWEFLRGVVGWEGRLLAYLASLVDGYPPFSLAGRDVAPAASSTQAR
jgi:hypothetical protein